LFKAKEKKTRKTRRRERSSKKRGLSKNLDNLTEKRVNLIYTETRGKLCTKKKRKESETEQKRNKTKHTGHFSLRH